MSLIKVPLLFADAIGMRITGKPPNEPLPLIEHVVPDWREKFLKSLAWPCVLLRVSRRRCPLHPPSHQSLINRQFTGPPASLK